MYSALIENMLKSKKKFNEGTGTVCNHCEDLSNNKQEKSEECKDIRKSLYGNCVLKRNNIYYLPLTASFNTPNTVEMKKIYTNLRKNKVAKATSFLFDCDGKRVSEYDLKDEISSNETKFSDWKKYSRYILPYEKGFSTNYITEKGFVLNEKCRENEHTPKTSYINSYLSALHHYYITPFIIPESVSYKPEAYPYNPETDELSHPKEVKIPEARLDGTNFKHEMNDDTYEFLSSIEDDGEDIKERPRDNLLKRTSYEEFEFDSEASSPQEELLRSPLRSLSTCNQYSSKVDFCNESDWSLVDDAFLVDPISCEEGFDPKESNSEVKIQKATFNAANFKNELDDNTYEYLSIIEDDGEYIKEQPWDTLLKGTSQDEFQFDSEASNSQEALLRSPSLRSFSTCDLNSSMDDFCEESDWSLVDDTCLVASIVREDDFDSQKVISVAEKSGFGILSYFKAMLRSNE